MVTLIFISGLLVSGVVYAYGKYSLMVALFIKATWALLFVASGAILYLLYRRYRRKKAITHVRRAKAVS